MTRKQTRLAVLTAALLCLAGATALVLTALQDSLAYFYAPSELATQPPPPDRALRMGGLVAEGSVERQADDGTVRFAVTDMAHAIPVLYRGALPDLFREGQGVVVEGRLTDGLFTAETVLAKHDETYMPREAVEALKRSGQWRPEDASGQ